MIGGDLRLLLELRETLALDIGIPARLVFIPFINYIIEMLRVDYRIGKLSPNKSSGGLNRKMKFLATSTVQNAQHKMNSSSKEPSLDCRCFNSNS